MAEARQKATEEWIGTVSASHFAHLRRGADCAVQSHDPLLFRMSGSKINGAQFPEERMEPVSKPVLTERMQQLAGIKPY